MSVDIVRSRHRFFREKAKVRYPKSMYQFAFLPSQFDKVVPWLMLNREGLDILVHPETGDTLPDHAVHSLWLKES